MAYSLPAAVQAALQRLSSFYNGNSYDGTTNPGGFDNDGHRVNFIPSLKDVASAGQAAADAATSATQDAGSTAADRAAVQAITQSGPVSSLNGKTGIVITDVLDVVTFDPTLDLLLTGDSPVPPGTFSRTGSNGGRNDARGAYALVADNNPRIDFDLLSGTALGLLMEPSSTNVMLYSNDLSNAAWTKTNGGISSVSGINFDGNFGLQRFTGTGTDSYIDQSTAATFGTGTYGYSFASVYLRSTAAKTIRISLLGGGAVLASRDCSVTTQWQRFSIGFNRSSSQTIGIRIGGNSTIGVGGTVDLAGPQVENSPYATSYIPTTTAALARDTDYVTIPATLNNWFNKNEFTMFVEGVFPALSPLTNPILTIGSAATDQFRIARVNNQMEIRGQNAGQQQYNTAFGLWNSAVKTRAAVAWRLGENISATFDGNVPTSVPFLSSGSMPGVVNSLQIGTDFSLLKGGGTFSRVSFWPRRVSDATLRAMTYP